MNDPIASPQARNWEMLHQFLHAEWQGTDYESFPYHAGMYEAYAVVARMMKEAAPGNREQALYEFLQTVMTGHGEEGGADD